MPVPLSEWRSAPTALPRGTQRLQKGRRLDTEAGDPRLRAGGGCCAAKGGVAMGSHILLPPTPLCSFGD